MTRPGRDCTRSVTISIDAVFICIKLNSLGGSLLKQYSLLPDRPDVNRSILDVRHIFILHRLLVPMVFFFLNICIVLNIGIFLSHISIVTYLRCSRAQYFFFHYHLYYQSHTTSFRLLDID